MLKKQKFCFLKEANSGLVSLEGKFPAIILVAKSPSALLDLDSLLSTMERLPTLRPDTDLLASIPLPVKDRPVLAAAIRGAATHSSPETGLTLARYTGLYSRE